MQRLFLIFLIGLKWVAGSAQNIDSILAAPQNIELTVSTPQPRMGETFQITLDINHLRANIFRSLIGRVELANQGVQMNNNSQMVINVTAVQKGKTVIAPISFTVNQTTYTTNAISYEAVDPLPQVDRGLWFRKVFTSDSSFCVIIEQRIPAKPLSVENGNSTTFSTVPESTDIAKFKDSYSIEGLSGLNSHTETSFGVLRVQGQERQYLSAYSVYYFNITNQHESIVITKDKLENIPADYQFKNIIIR